MNTLKTMQEFIDMTYVDHSFVLYFSSPSCQPCRKLRPIMQKIHDDHIIDVHYVDASECDPEILETLEVRSVPALWFSNAGGFTRLNSRTIIGLIGEINDLKDAVNE